MFDKAIRRTALALPLWVGVGAAGLAMGAGDNGAGSGPLRCQIETTAAGGMVTLSGVVHTDVALSGSYRFRVVVGGRSGNSNIEQGGGFTASPASPATLGSVRLSAGGVYDANLEVTADGTTVGCANRDGAQSI